MKIFTIGYTQKSAEEFFDLLIANKVECLIDVRLNNSSQLAAFTKHRDLEYFLKVIANINYIHDVKYAPTKDILDDYKKSKISWQAYEVQYSNICFLCSEFASKQCHRRILAEYLKSILNDIEVIHL